MTFRLAQICGLLLIFAAEAAAQAPGPSPRFACDLFDMKYVQRFDSLSAMAPQVVKVLLERFAAQAGSAGHAAMIAERDARWQGTDAVQPGSRLPERRFIYGLRHRNRWFIWYERGGYAPTAHIVAYDFTPATPGPVFVIHLMTAPEELCAVTGSLLWSKLLPSGGLDSGAW